MSALKSLTFTTLPKIGANPTLDRRTNMIARLEEQKLLLNDPNYIRTVRAWVKKNGELTPIDRQQRVLPWWRVNADGSYVFFVRLGSKPIEFEKGKNAIAVPSLDKMPLIINILITAVRNGELDEQLAQTKKPAVCAEVPQDGVILTVAMRPSGLPVQKTNESAAAGMASRPLRTRAHRFQSVR
jgi:hypothetical protein